MKDHRFRRLADRALRLVTAGILFQTLFLKFTGAAESVYIFRTLHMEPWGRIGSGLAELLCCALLLWSETAVLGALFSLGVIAGALVSHVTVLGIEVQGDGGLLFGLACTVLVLSLALVWLRRNELPFVGRRFVRRRAHRHLDAAPDGPRPKRILILGGGFGGVYTALELEKLLAFDDAVEVTLVNRENTFLFTPMLHEVAASDLDPSNIVSPIRKLLARVDFFQGEALALDLAARVATLRHGSDGHEHAFAYDVLVLGLGSTTNFFGLEGLEERALCMKSLADALRLRNRLIGSLEEADTECAAAIREPLLTFVVAGGGFSGVETVAGMNDFLRAALPSYRHLGERDLRVVLVHPGDVVLPELGPALGRYAQTKLAARGVEIRTRTRVEAVGPDLVRLSDGSELRARTLVWTAGTSPHPLLERLEAPKERGRLRVDERLLVQDLPGVLALGDCAAVPDATAGGLCPPTAQHALRQARVAAHNALALVHGREPRERFRFATLGALAAIGRRTGVARILGLNFSGFVAWWLWRTIYLAKLPRLEKKLRVVLDWTLDVLFSKDLVQLGTEPARTLASDTLQPTAASATACPLPSAASVRPAARPEPLQRA